MTLNEPDSSGAQHLQIPGGPPACLIYLEERAGGNRPGVVDEDIDIREQLAEARYIGAVAEIAGVRANRDVVAILDFPARAFEGSGTAGYEHKVTALSRKSISYRASNAPGTTGNERKLAAEIEVQERLR
jgi:hypothetical protein